MFDAQEIIEGIWLGSEDAAEDLQGLKERNINFVLSAGFGLSQPYSDKGITYEKIPAIDLPVYKISKDLPKAIQFIGKSQEENGVVLVHCARGVSRSATVVIGYLMFSQKISYQEAKHLVTSKRSIARPNSGFQSELENFQANNFNIENL